MIHYNNIDFESETALNIFLKACKTFPIILFYQNINYISEETANKMLKGAERMVDFIYNDNYKDYINKNN